RRRLARLRRRRWANNVAHHRPHLGQRAGAWRVHERSSGADQSLPQPADALDGQRAVRRGRRVPRLAAGDGRRAGPGLGRRERPRFREDGVMLRISNLKKAFGGHEVLKDVSFEIADRDKVALVGANGAGKSSLLKIVARVLEADEGTVKVQGPAAADVAYLPQ